MRRTGLIVSLGACFACSSGGAGNGPGFGDLAMTLPDASATDDAGSGSGPDGGSADGSGAGRDSGSSGVDLRSPADLSPAADLAWDGSFTVRVLADNFCKLSSTPTTLAVAAGTSFRVTWINSAASDYDINIDKIDAFNQVPLYIGLAPGKTWTDMRDWCGIFTGTFQFRVRIACDTYYIPVNCSK